MSPSRRDLGYCQLNHVGFGFFKRLLQYVHQKPLQFLRFFLKLNIFSMSAHINTYIVWFLGAAEWKDFLSLLLIVPQDGCMSCYRVRLHLIGWRLEQIWNTCLRRMKSMPGSIRCNIFNPEWETTSSHTLFRLHTRLRFQLNSKNLYQSI